MGEVIVKNVNTEIYRENRYRRPRFGIHEGWALIELSEVPKQGGANASVSENHELMAENTHSITLAEISTADRPVACFSSAVVYVSR